MSYQALRTFADSYGLAAMVAIYLVLVFWGFRPGSRPHNDAAANMIFADESEETARNRDTHHG